MAEKPPTEKSTPPLITTLNAAPEASKEEIAKKQEEEETRVNSRASVHPGSEHDPTIATTDESKYYLPTRRLIPVHIGVLL